KLDKDGDEIGYDYSSEDYGNTTGLLVIGSNPANVAAQAGKTVTSKAKIVAGDVTYDWIVNVTLPVKYHRSWSMKECWFAEWVKQPWRQEAPMRWLPMRTA